MSARPQPLVAELLADRALVGLSSAEELTLERLLDEQGAALDEGLELAAAALDRALAPAHEALPAALHARLVAAAADFAPRPATLRAQPRAAQASAPPRGRLFALSGWILAAAAGVLALLAWGAMRRALPGALSPAAQRSALLARADTLRLDCSATEQAPGASGDVAWSQTLQQGVLHLEDLPVNDPLRTQYQLWIFDAAQQHPVDGGVFDVTGGEVLIPIDAKLAVREPTLFAITLEQPGGVVVSDQQRIVLVAKP